MLRRGRRERLVQTEAPAGEPFDHGFFRIDVEPWPQAELDRARAVAAGHQSWLFD
jgi:hypothetical protein